MNMMKKWLMAVGFMLGVAVAHAGVTVTNVVIQQRYPWNGLVDINYEILTDDPDLEASIYPTGYDRQNGKYVLMSTLTGDGVGAKVKAGQYHMIWNMTKDAPMLVSTNFSVNLQAVSGMAPYLVIDLSGGPDVSCYPVQYFSSIPAGGWSDEFKTTKLVLRLIMPDTFIMGSPLDELGRGSDEVQHQVTLTKPYYIGVFEVTQKQWKLVMNANPSQYQGDARPVGGVSYDVIRGGNLGSKWPTTNTVDVTSFMGKIRVKTGLIFDLPTDAQWECACRAGTSTALNNGMNLLSTYDDAGMMAVGRYQYNKGDGKGGYSQHTKVGSYLPNAWGLYDMHGNVREWCLDYWTDNLGTAAVTNPKGASSGSTRLNRGGGWKYEYANQCRAAYRTSRESRDGGPDDDQGFRLTCLSAVQ